MRPAGGVVVPGIGDDGGRVGFCRVAHPDPEEGVLLDQREAADAGAFGDAVLAGDVDAGAGAVEGQAVVAAGQALLGHLAEVQRRAAVAAHVQERAALALGVAEQDDWLVQMRRASGRSVTSSAQAATYQALRMNMSAELPCYGRRLRDAVCGYHRGRTGVGVKLWIERGPIGPGRCGFAAG